MKITRVLSTLIVAIPIFAADAPLPEMKTEPAAAGSVITVKNPYSQPLAAFVIELVDYPDSKFTLIPDELGPTAIQPGAEKKYNVSNMVVGTAPDHVKLFAAVYLDGATAGAADKVKEIIERRRSKLETIRELTARIEKSQAAGKDKDAIVADLREWAATIAPPRPLSGVPVDLIKVAKRALVGTTAAHINTAGVAPELANLKKSENELAASKPSL